LAAGESAAGQLLVWANSVGLVPAIVIELMLRVPLPVLVRVEVLSALTVPCVMLPKLSEVGLNEAIGVRTPVPVAGTVGGEAAASSVTATEALAVAATEGWKTTDIVHVTPTARVEPQVVAEMPYSPGFVPPSVMLLILRVAVPGLL